MNFTNYNDNYCFVYQSIWIFISISNNDIYQLLGINGSSDCESHLLQLLIASIENLRKILENLKNGVG